MTPGFFRTTLRAAASLSLLLTTSASFAQAPKATAKTSDLSITSRLNATYAKLPLAFEPNRGQTDANVQFMARAPQGIVFLSGSDAVVQTSILQKDAHGIDRVESATAVRMHLVGAEANPKSAPEQMLSGTVSYLTGNDHSKWHAGLPTYSGVYLSSVYPGVDLRYYGHAGRLEYDFIVAANADPSALKMQFQGSTASIAKNGDLELPTSTSTLRFDKPVAYQTIDGKRINVEAAFTLNTNREISFKLGAYDRQHELIIDPTLIYLGTLGTGVGNVDVSQIVVDSTGALYLTGTTNDATFPVTTGAYQTVCGPANATATGNNIVYCSRNYTSAFIAKLSADGTKLVYSTYLSGHPGGEQGGAIAVDSVGVAYIFGNTGSDDFPVTSDAFQKNCYAYYGVFGGPNIVKCDGFYNGGGTEYTIGNRDGFFAKLNANGSSLLYSSFLGGTAPVYPNSIALDAGGNIYLSGQVAAFDPADLAGCGSKCGPNSQGQLQFTGITSNGYITISGAVSPNNGLNTTINTAAFLSKFSNDGHTLLYGTFFGDNTSGAAVVPRTMAVGANGIAFLGGETGAGHFPVTAGAVKSACVQTSPGYSDAYCQTEDGFVAAIDTTKSGVASLVYSTRLGGTATVQGSNTDDQQVIGLAVDSSNDVFATGYTFEHTFPVGSGGYQEICPNYNPNDTTDRCDSAFVVKLNPTGTKLLAGTFLGGPNPRAAESVGYNVRLDSRGQVYLYGRSSDGGGDFPQVNPLQPYKGGNQLFISAFTADLSKLLFSTRFGNPSYPDHSVSVAGGMVLDSSDNIYFAGTTNDATFNGTTGTYNTATTTGQGDHAFFAKLSKVLQPVAVTLTISPNPANQGSNVTYKAVVVGSYQTTPVPTGNVSFQLAGIASTITIGTGTLDNTGIASFTGTAPAAGTYSATANYTADSVYDVGSSTAVSFTASSKSVTTTSVLSSAPTAGMGTSVTFTASVMPAVAGAPTGSVTFYDGNSTSGTVIGSGTISGGMASVMTALLSTGTHNITAVYSGDTLNASSISAPLTEVISVVTIELTVSPPSLIVSRGSSAMAVISATPNGAYSGTLMFSCGTLPANASCSFSPASLTFNSSTAKQTTTFTFSTQRTHAMLERTPAWNGMSGIATAVLFLPLGFVGLLRRRRTNSGGLGMLLLLVALTTAIASMMGCGGSGNAAGSTASTPTGTYTVPVVATVNGGTTMINLNVTVQ